MYQSIVCLCATAFVLVLGQAQKDGGVKAGPYNLIIVSSERLAYPGEGNLQNANSALTQQGVGKGFSVQLTRHHIIPYSRMRAFWNKFIGEDKPSFRLAFLEMGKNIGSYASGMRLDSRNPQIRNYISGAERIANALADTSANAIYHDARSSQEPEGLRAFQDFYGWLPGNTFVGPSARSDDPSDGFETGAAAAVGSNFQNLQELNDLIVQYLSGGSVSISKLSAKLINIAKRKEIYPLKADAWGQTGGQYYLKKA